MCLDVLLAFCRPNAKPRRAARIFLNIGVLSVQFHLHETQTPQKGSGGRLKLATTDENYTGKGR